MLWLQLPGAGEPRLLWHLWHQGAAYVLVGPGEQQPEVGELPATARVTIPVAGADPLVWTGVVTGVTAADDTWDELLPVLLGRRLNPPDGDGAARRWSRECRLLRIVPVAGGAVG